VVVKKTQFRQYQNKNSLRKRYCRYAQGGNTDEFTNRLGWWERFDLTDTQNDDIFIPKLSKTYEKRPDLLAFDMYNRSDYDWVILQYNNIVDIEEEFITGVSLIVPSKLRVNIDIMSNASRNINVEP
jgi:hypothetical protein